MARMMAPQSQLFMIFLVMQTVEGALRMSGTRRGFLQCCDHQF